MVSKFLLTCLSILFSLLNPLIGHATDTFESTSSNKFSHEGLFVENQYPSAKQCATCHIEHYNEWSVSPHSYAQISPIFNAMQATTVKRTNGTTGDFCIRCHTPVGMQIGEPVFTSNLNRADVSNEGITCITCHRRNEPIGKSSGRFNIFAGDIFKTVYGPAGNEELERVIYSGEFEVNADPKKDGRNIHADAKEFKQIKTSAFCGTCHDVNSASGFRLEEAFSEYKASPAASENTTCQDCHMSKEPGLNSGFDHKSIAIVGGKPTKPRKKTNHMFIGPDYSVVHPGIFPHSIEASNFASMKEWIQFKHNEGWGTDDFEDELINDYKFPERWSDASERFQAREIIDQNLERLEKAHVERKKMLQRGYKLGDIEIKTNSKDSFKFEVEFKNITSGHNVPTGFDAERVVFLRVEVKDKNEKVIFKSGDLDPNGDLRDRHSLYVINGKVDRDKQLFNLQSKFLTNMISGGDREEVLPINNSISPLPFVRPPIVPTILTGRPTDSRKHRQTIPPLSSRWASYSLNDEDLKDASWPLNINVKLISGMVPVNLVHEISEVGFDYEMSPKEIAEKVVEGHQILWEETRVISAHDE